MKLVSLLLLALISLPLAVSFGSVDISLADTFSCLTNHCSSASDQLIIEQLRLPRVLLGFVAGGALACAGLLLQNISRNPLADPYIFGLVAGAGLAVTLAQLVFNLSAWLQPVAAFIGAIVAVFLMLMLAKRLYQISQLLLAGVAIAFLLSAVSQLLLYYADPLASQRIMFWLMGSLTQASMQQVVIVLSCCIFVGIFITALHRQFDALALGDDHAMQLGISVQKLKLGGLMLSALLTAVVVAFCGGIAFVGLMIPHILRQLVQGSLTKLALGCFLLGGVFLVWVDVIARSINTLQEIPIGIVTSILGALFFISLLNQSKQG